MKPDIRNIAIIAHVDHGKTTLVDHILRQSGSFAAHKEVDDRVMDSMDLERERGITISAKNCAFTYEGTKVNLVDTPGHSDFGGEVERILDMVDGALLLVDASEGPLPQTRFVLQHALRRNLKIIVCINKIDRKDARTEEVLDEIFDLFIDLEATEEQAAFETLYMIARDGKVGLTPDSLDGNLKLLFDWMIAKIPAPVADASGPVQMLVSNIDYSAFVGRLAVGRLRQGTMKVGDQLTLMGKNESQKPYKVSALFSFQSNEKAKVTSIEAGDIAIVAGLDEINIGDTLACSKEPKSLPRIEIAEPTVGLNISINDGPFAGLEGKLVTSRQIRDRLEKELLQNVSIQIQSTDRQDSWKILGRGELQLAVLLEQMRREGFEFCISKPKVVFKKDDNGALLEPMENLRIDLNSDYVGIVTQTLGERKGILINMSQSGVGRTCIEFSIPSRGLIGYRSQFLTDTRGTGLMNSSFGGFQAYKGDLSLRTKGAMVADRKGKATAYALDNLSDRGSLFIVPTTQVYDGMIVGEINKGIDLEVNVTKEKKLTNIRASGTDESVKLAPVPKQTLERAMEWIEDNELIEVTPLNIRLRCTHLDPHLRKKKR